MIGDENSNRPDGELARLAADGDAAAFDEIYSRHRRFVYSLAVRMTGNQADAEDLTQESFVSVLRRIGSFRGEASFTTWLYRPRDQSGQHALPLSQVEADNAD